MIERITIRVIAPYSERKDKVKLVIIAAPLRFDKMEAHIVATSTRAAHTQIVSCPVRTVRTTPAFSPG